MSNNKILMIIQARMESERLPGKSMMELAGEPLVGRILERVKKCKNLSDIVLAIPNNKKNFCLRDLAEKYNVNAFLGSEHDLVNRYYEAGKFYKADIIVRLPADNPVPEAIEIDKIISLHLSLQKRGFTSNLASIFGSDYPDGIGAEVFDFSLLSEINYKQKTSKQKEHLHLNFFNYESQKPIDEDWCPINTLKCPEKYRRPDIILDVNTYEQYLFMRELYQDLYFKNPNFNIMDIIKWYDKKKVIKGSEK